MIVSYTITVDAAAIASIVADRLCGSIPITTRLVSPMRPPVLASMV